MVLQGDRQTIGMQVVLGAHLVAGDPQENAILMDGVPVVQNGDPRRFHHLFVRKVGGTKEDVVGVPLADARTGVGIGRVLAIEGTGHAIGVGLAAGAFEDLHFVKAHEENTRVAPGLALVPGLRLGHHPLHMQVHVAEHVSGLDLAGAALYDHGAVLNGPLGGAGVIVEPGARVLAPEQHLGALGGRGLHTGGPLDARGQGAPHVMDFKGPLHGGFRFGGLGRKWNGEQQGGGEKHGPIIGVLPPPVTAAQNLYCPPCVAVMS